METPYSGRATVNDNFDSIEIVIPSKKNWFIILFMCAWMGGWVMGEFFAITSILKGETFSNLFLVFWVIGWTVGGLFVIRTLVWNFSGHEIITATSGQLTIIKKAVIVLKSKTYDLNSAKDFRILDDGSNDIFSSFGGRRTNPWSLDNGGLIRFDYGMETIKFAGGISEAEAKSILDKLKDKKYLSSINFSKEAINTIL